MRTHALWKIYNVVHLRRPEFGFTGGSVFCVRKLIVVGFALCFGGRDFWNCGAFAAVSIFDVQAQCGKHPRCRLKRLAHRRVHCFIRFGNGPCVEISAMPFGSTSSRCISRCAAYTRCVVAAIPPYTFSFRTHLCNLYLAINSCASFCWQIHHGVLSTKSTELAVGMSFRTVKTSHICSCKNTCRSMYMQQKAAHTFGPFGSTWYSTVAMS